MRKLHSSVGLLDPEVAEDLYAEELLTKLDKEKIDAEAVPTKRARLILTTLERRNPKKSLKALIKALEKSKEQNEEFLIKISEGI